MRFQGLYRGVKLLLLVQVPKIPSDILRIGPGRVGRPGGCVPVPTLQDGVHPANVGLDRYGLKTHPNLCCGGPRLSPGVHKKVLSHGFSGPPIHVAFVERVTA